MEPVDLFAIVLVLAVLIGCINHIWIRLPPAIGMLLGSLAVSLLIVGSDHVLHLQVMRWFRLTLSDADLPHFFLDGVLALLLFAGSLHVDVAELNRRRWLILLLATASVLLSASLFGYGMYVMSGLIGAAVPLAWCVVLGAILAPTDAVVVENLLRKAGLPARLRAAIVGESLFNDGAGVVLFLLALGVTQGDVIHLGHGRVAGALLREIAGGAMLGVIAGWLAALLLRRINDDGLQLLISLALVLGCYRLALLAELSGPIAVVAAGLCLGSPSPRFSMTANTRSVLLGFWSPLNQILNIMLFLLMGLHILALVIQPIQLLPLAFAIPLAVVSRFVSVAVPLALTRENVSEKLRAATVLTWAGLRGGISIALALTLPPSPWRTDLLVVTYGVVVFTIVAQGLTFPHFLRVAYGAKQQG
ncbi:MAG: sodium:proton antiporter [Xanthobacteraceae bacterium]